jgi:AraC family transcriptional regulator
MAAHSDPMYGEGLSLALAVHVLRAYGGIAAGLQNAQGGLSRAKLMRAIEYIQDTLETGLTVAAIARTVHMSPSNSQDAPSQVKIRSRILQKLRRNVQENSSVIPRS